MKHDGDARVWGPSPHPPLTPDSVHVWRVSLDAERGFDESWSLLSADEQARAQRFHREQHRQRFVLAHGALRRILGGYLGARPHSLAFVAGEHGKPALSLDEIGGAEVQFNLSHSGDLALVAVTQSSPVGVDVERWKTDMEHLAVAERFFSPAERAALQALGSHEHVIHGFFAAWTRKEAYLKATGMGIAHGLHHFDVTLAPDQPVRLLADRLDSGATERFRMAALAPADGYSAALVVGAPVDRILLFDASTLTDT